MPIIQNGLLLDPYIIHKICPNIERGQLDLNKIKAIVIHQTDSDTAQSTLNAWSTRKFGAHFLIDRGGSKYVANGKKLETIDGKIYQTAKLDKKCLHVGKIRSRCLATLSCAIPKGKKLSDEGKAKGKPSTLYNLEIKKDYPNRYPVNEDSIGIEIVGKYNSTTQQYPALTRGQSLSALWLIETLGFLVPGITAKDVYAHGDISYKMPSEGAAIWTAVDNCYGPFWHVIGRPVIRK